MVQDQLVDYISSQMKLGVPHESIKAALVGAGWVAADVDDTMKKVGETEKPAALPGTMSAAPAVHVGGASAPAGGSSPMGSPHVSVGASPAGAMSAGSMSAMGAASTAAKPASSPMTMGTGAATAKPSMSMGTSPAGAGAPALRVSDLVSATAGKSASAAPMTSLSSLGKGSSPMTGGTIAKPQSSMGMGGSGMGASMAAAAHPEKKGRGMMIVGIVIIVALVGAAGYLLFENMSLAGQISSLNGTSSGVSSQISDLNNQISNMVASNTALMARVETLTAQSADLAANLSFVAIPSGTAQGATSTVTVSGKLAGGKAVDTLTTPYGVIIYVANSKDAKVSAALTPLVNGTNTVQLTGTHVIGSPNLTVTAVNGTPVNAPAPAAATTTATSTASSTTP